MKKVIVTALLLNLIGGVVLAQEMSVDSNSTVTPAKIKEEGKLSIGGYAQVDYNQPLNDTAQSNGKLDVHRMVLLVGYNFNDRVNFVTEIELEHVKEVFVEQAYLNYRIIQPINFRAGLMLIPMGIVNEYHDPPRFNGVERPNLDNKIVPSTWREIGAGFTGNIDNLSLKYQAYIVNGFLGYNGGGKFRGSDGFRKGRQKGAESIISNPNFSTKIDFYGIKGLKLGAAAYLGKSQSSLYDGLQNNDTTGGLASADSSVLGLTMIGLDARYQYKAFQCRAQFITATISNVNEYNSFTGADMGTSMLGYYGEIGYDVLSIFNKEAKEKVILFGRYEYYDTQNTVTEGMLKTGYYSRTDITVGITYKVSDGSVFKADYQLFDNDGLGNKPSKQINVGIGVQF